ncbi:MAG: hypothetical protein WCY09_08215 [Candidatus Omnitrophota bacterium]
MKRLNTAQQAVVDAKMPEGADFQVMGIQPHYLPHPYCVGTRHIDHAQKFGGMLGVECIRDGEKNGKVRCETKGCTLSFDEHTTEQFLIVKVKDNSQEALHENVTLMDFLREMANVLVTWEIDNIALPLYHQLPEYDD